VSVALMVMVRLVELAKAVKLTSVLVAIVLGGRF
jgi:hypothetical protein